MSSKKRYFSTIFSMLSNINNYISVSALKISLIFGMQVAWYSSYKVMEMDFLKKKIFALDELEKVWKKIEKKNSEIFPIFFKFFLKKLIFPLQKKKFCSKEFNPPKIFFPEFN